MGCVRAMSTRTSEREHRTAVQPRGKAPHSSKMAAGDPKGDYLIINQPWPLGGTAAMLPII